MDERRPYDTGGGAHRLSENARVINLDRRAEQRGIPSLAGHGSGVVQSADRQTERVRYRHMRAFSSDDVNLAHDDSTKGEAWRPPH